MAYMIGLMGDYSSGKSYSRRFIKDGRECFLISPSAKVPHLLYDDEDGSRKPVGRFSISSERSPDTKSYIDGFNKALNAKFTEVADMLAWLANNPATANKLVPTATITGNHVAAKLRNVEGLLKFISDYMPHIKTIFIGDFTHFLSQVLADTAFISRKAGGEAFQRFWELAGEALRSLILAIDQLREDLVVVTEYHTVYNEADDIYRIFVPGGQMLTEKFKIESYYDYMLGAAVAISEQTGEATYNFVTERVGRYNARFSNWFEQKIIPNDMGLVLDTFRQYVGI